jgi:trehalose 6-phosphate phosphatase
VSALPEVLRPLLTQPERSALCLDFDGTLSAIVAEPTAARPLHGVPELLARLAERFGVVAVISGRPVGFLHDVLLAPPGVRLFGLYGLERFGPTGIRAVAPGAEKWEAVVADAASRATAAAPPGVYVEPKGLTVTLHWRHATASRPWVETFVGGEVDGRGLVAHHSRMSIELGPPLTVDKGTIVAELAAGMAAVAAFGDDVGDLPAFAALGALADQGIAVARVAVVDDESAPEVAAAADLVVQGASGAVELLLLLADLSG